jgi:hypothetical protein
MGQNDTQKVGQNDALSFAVLRAVQVKKINFLYYK